DTFLEGLKVEPENVRVLNELGITYRANNQKQLAIDTFLKVIEDIDPKHVPSYNELGITYRANNQKQLAIDTFLEGLKVEPENVRVLNELGITYRANNQKQLAIDTFLKAIEIDPKATPSYNELGITYRANNQKQLAIDTFLEGLKVEPENVRVLNELGITYRENNQFGEAIQIIEKALAINPKNEFLLLNLLQIFLFFKPDKTKAKVFYDKLNDIRPAYPSFKNNRKNYEVSIENLSEIWKFTVDDFKIYGRYVFAAIQYKAYHTVLPLLFELNKKYPRNSKIISRLGKTLSNQVICRSKEGREFLNKVIELFEKEHNETQLIGHIFFYLYSLLNDEEFEILNKEIECFKNKIEHLPNYFRLLGKYFEQLDKAEEEIIECFEKAIEISPSNDEKKWSVKALLYYLTNKDSDKYKIRIEQLKEQLRQFSPAAKNV
ncbi:MAG: tetratricopeptide repeat protein, partial [Nitrosopumilus sp.]